jgi:hypothetical protein
MLSNAQLLMAVMYRPITRQYKDAYEIEPYQGATKHADKFHNVPASHFYGMMVFFLTTRSKYMNSTLRSLIYLAKKKKATPQTSLEQGGGGITSLLKWLKKMLQKLKI